MDQLRRAHPGLVVEIVPMTTQGDRVLDRALADVGGKGLFVGPIVLGLVVALFRFMTEDVGPAEGASSS